MPARKEKIKLTCGVCRNPFEVEPYRANRAKFCGWSCKQKAGAAIANAKIIEKYRGTGSKTYVKENGRHQHRVVMEAHIGRPLLSTEIVHHKDGNKKNNKIDNLELVDCQSSHVKMHVNEMLAARKSKHGY